MSLRESSYIGQEKQGDIQIHLGPETGLCPLVKQF